MCLFTCALWSPAGKGLTSWLSFVVSNCEFGTFPLVSWVQVTQKPDYQIEYYLWSQRKVLKERYLGSAVVECLTRDRRAAGSSLTGVVPHCVGSLSKNINPSLVLVQHRKTRPFIAERLLMGRKGSYQTNQKKWYLMFPDLCNLTYF